MEQVLATPGTTTLKRVDRDVGEGVSRALTAVGAQLPEPPAVTRDDREATPRTVVRELAAPRDRINATIGAAQSVIGDGRTIVRSAGGDNGSNPATARPARKTPVRDAVNNASSDITKAVTKVSDGIKNALRGKDDDGDGGEGGAQ